MGSGLDSPGTPELTPCSLEESSLLPTTLTFGSSPQSSDSDGDGQQQACRSTTKASSRSSSSSGSVRQVKTELRRSLTMLDTSLAELQGGPLPFPSAQTNELIFRLREELNQEHSEEAVRQAENLQTRLAATPHDLLDMPPENNSFELFARGGNSPKAKQPQRQFRSITFHDPVHSLGCASPSSAPPTVDDGSPVARLCAELQSRHSNFASSPDMRALLDEATAEARELRGIVRQGLARWEQRVESEWQERLRREEASRALLELKLLQSEKREQLGSTEEQLRYRDTAWIRLPSPCAVGYARSTLASSTPISPSSPDSCKPFGESTRSSCFQWPQYPQSMTAPETGQSHGSGLNSLARAPDLVCRGAQAHDRWGHSPTRGTRQHLVQQTMSSQDPKPEHSWENNRISGSLGSFGDCCPVCQLWTRSGACRCVDARFPYS